MSTKILTLENPTHFAVLEITPVYKDGRVVRRAVMTVATRIDSEMELYTPDVGEVDAKYEMDCAPDTEYPEIVRAMLEVARFDY